MGRQKDRKKRDGHRKPEWSLQRGFFFLLCRLTCLFFFFLFFFYKNDLGLTHIFPNCHGSGGRENDRFIA